VCVCVVCVCGVCVCVCVCMIRSKQEQGTRRSNFNVNLHHFFVHMLVHNKHSYKILVGKPTSKMPLRGPGTDRIILKINLTTISRVIMNWENYPNQMQTKTALCRQNAEYFTF